MSICVYLSGPPCAGKSTAAVEVIKNVPGIEYIRGDDFWVRYPELSFPSRVLEVNEHILTEVRNSKAESILCEWVPSRAEFVNRLYAICDEKGKSFVHVVLTAPLPALKMRKKRRDGDEELGPAPLDLSESDSPWKRRVFDTHSSGILPVVREIVAQYER